MRLTAGVDLNPSFVTELRQAMAGQEANQISALKPTLTPDTAAVSSRRDGNTVELETELLNLNQNMLANAVESHLVTSSLLKLRLAITGRSA
ncbi:MAG: hypothetical protein U1G07_01650 [Verrucomicrobiota bacterium]